MYKHMYMKIVCVLIYKHMDICTNICRYPRIYTNRCIVKMADDECEQIENALNMSVNTTDKWGT